MDLFLLINAGVVIILGIMALRFNPKSAKNLSFFLYCSAITLWMLLMYISSIHPSLIYIRFAMLGAALMTLAQYFFIQFFTESKTNTVQQVIISTIASFLASTAIIPDSKFTVFTEVTVHVNNIVPLPGYFFVPFAVFFVCLTIFNCGRLIRLFFSENKHLRSQALVINIGFIGAYSLIIFFNFVLVNFFQNSSLLELGTSAISVFVLSAAYAMTRYRFLDVKIIVQKHTLDFLVFFIPTFILSLALMMVWPLVYSAVGLRMYLLAAVFAVVVLIYFFAIYHVWRKLKWYIDGKYSSDALDFHKYMHPADLELNSVHELHSFALKYSGMVQELIEAKVIHFYIRQEQYHRYTAFYSFGPKINLSSSATAIEELRKISDINAMRDFDLDDNTKHVRTLMQKSGAEMIVAIRDPHNKEDILGILLIGRHKNNIPFSQEHIADIQNLLPYAAETIPKLLSWQQSIESLEYRLRSN